MSCAVIQYEQGGEIHSHPGHGVKPSAGQPPLVKPGIVQPDRQRGRQVYGQQDPEPIDKHSGQIGYPETEKGPADFFLFCIHAVNIRKDKHGNGNHHELDTGTGWRNDKAEGIIHISCNGVIFKRNPA